MANALSLTGGSWTSETTEFVRKIDKFFDCLNVNCFDEGKLKRKPFLQPYRSLHDFRLLV